MKTRRNHSKKRAEILEALRSTKTHPTAEMLYNKLKESDPSIGLATVYRNLAVLQDEGSVVSVGCVNGQERYDADTRVHGHFICRKCSGVFDVELPESAVKNMDAVPVLPGFTVENRELRLWGACPACSRNV